MLKLVDKFVKEGKYEDALRILSQSREDHPSNAYTLAYEERVLSLLNDKRRRVLQGSPDEASLGSIFTPVMEQFSGMANQHTAGDTGSVAPDVREPIENLLSLARDLRKIGEFDNALDQVSQAFLLGPPSSDLVQLEEQLWREREIAVRRANEKKAITKGSAEAQGDSGSSPTGATAAPLPGGVEQIENDRQIVARLRRAHSLLESGELDGALEEVAHARQVDPSDKQVNDMELLLLSKQEKVRIVAERNRRMEKQVTELARAAADKKTFAWRKELTPPAEDSRAFIGILPLITSAPVYSAGNHCERAEMFMQKKHYDDASLEIALGLIVDSRHEGLLLMKEEILNLSRTTTGSTSEDSTTKQKNVSDHMRAAQILLAQHDFAGALETLAGAYELDPENKEVRKLEMVIRREELLRQKSGSW